MDVLKISETKVKIMLTPEDIKNFGIDLDEVDYNDKTTRTKIWDVLDYAKKKHGFDYGKDKLLIQFYPSKDGGAELFVTRLSGIPKVQEKAIAKAENVTLLDINRRAYCFKSFRDLCAASAAVCKRKSIKESELYYSEAYGYILKITERAAIRGGVSDLAILSEFCAYSTDDRIPYISEHCKSLASNGAIDKLAKLHVGSGRMM